MCDTREEKEKTRRGVTETRRKDTMFVCIWMCGFVCVCVCVCVYNRGERPLIAAAEAADQIRSRRALKCLIGNCVCECVCVCVCERLMLSLNSRARVWSFISHTHTHTHTHTHRHTSVIQELQNPEASLCCVTTSRRKRGGNRSRGRGEVIARG